MAINLDIKIKVVTRKVGQLPILATTVIVFGKKYKLYFEGKHISEQEMMLHAVKALPFVIEQLSKGITPEGVFEQHD